MDDRASALSQDDMMRLSDGATVFAGSTGWPDNKLYAIDAASGTEKWVFQTGGCVTSPVLIE